MVDSNTGDSLGNQGKHKAWVYELNSYQWFVLTVCTLGWVFDCMGQQLFNVSRKPAVAGLMGLNANSPTVDYYGTLATSLMLIGWATGGIIFGILGDKIGRAKTMVLTILIYSIFTGLSGCAVSIGDFILYRFLCGLGVGGQFSVGVSLVAEYMPGHIRPKALGLLQAMANWGNVSAGLIGVGFGQILSVNLAWRWTLAIGALPAFLAIPVFLKLRDPDSWKAAVAEGAKKKVGSLKELFSDPRWRKNTIIGMILATTGVIGLWGIGFFSIDLNQSVFRKKYEAQQREKGEVAKDREFLMMVLDSPDKAEEYFATLSPKFFIPEQPRQKDNQEIFAAVVDLHKQGQDISQESVLSLIEKQSPLSPENTQSRKQRLAAYFAPLGSTPSNSLEEHAARITDRATVINSKVSFWAGWTAMLFNIGGFFGAYAFSYVTGYIGRRWAFALSFLLAGVTTSLGFMYVNSAFDVFWMTPLMGFCIFLIFGGYAVYFPELYPTRLRSTGTSFCYNIGRIVAAIGPLGLGLLCSVVYKNAAEPMRYAGATMCLIFIVGLCTLPFAPETKGKPLPE